MIAGEDGHLVGRGKFARIAIEMFESENVHVDPSEDLERRLRFQVDFVLGWAVGEDVVSITPIMWQPHGGIFEHNTLIQWDWPDWHDPRIPTRSPQPTYGNYAPYTMAELICLTDVKIEVDSFLAWQETLGEKPRHNERGAGRKPSTDWDEVEKFLQDQINADRPFAGRGRVYECVLKELWEGEPKAGERALFNQMQKREKFWPKLNAAIKRSGAGNN